MAEAGVLNLPPLENGVLAIGDLWDCRSSQRVGFNLFANNLTLGAIEVIPISNSSNILKQSKSTHDTFDKLKIGAEVSAELIGGLLKISGGLDFEKTNGKKLAQESADWVAHRNTYKLKLKANNSDDLERYIDLKVKDLIQKGLICPTHIVKEVELGGSAMGSIKISQSNTNTKYKFGFFVAGEINLVVASAQIKIEAEVSEEVRTSNYEMRVSLKSVPPLSPPVEPTDFITLPSQMDKQMKLECHFPEFGDIHGIPKTFILVPISQYVKGLPEKNPYEAPPEQMSKDFTKMLGEIRDLSYQEFLRHKLLDSRPELLKIISDSEHLITAKIIEKETQIRNGVMARESSALEIYLKNKHLDKPNWDELGAEIQIYINQKYGEQIEEFVEELKDEGMDELEPVRISDEELEGTSDEKCPLQFFTNKNSLTSWMSTDMMHKILFRTKIGTKSEGIQLRLYKMAILLGKFGMESGIAYPSVSSPEGIEVSHPLEIKTQMELHSFSENGDALMMINVLEAGVGKTSAKQPSSRAFGVFAEFLGIPLPMSDKMEHLIPLFNFIKSKTQGFEIINNVDDTLAIMMEKSQEYKYVVTSDALHSITDNIPCLGFIKPNNGRLIVGTFGETSLLNAPNIFLCYDGDLLGICLDHLDTMILIHIEEHGNNSPDFSILSPSAMTFNSFSPHRLKFAEEVAEYFGEFEFDQHKQSSLFPPNPSADLSFALNIATALLDDGGNAPMAITTALIHAVKDTLGNEIFPPSRPLPGWSELDGIIIQPDDSDKWNILLNELKFVLYKEQHPFVFILQQVISELEVFYGGIEEVEQDKMELHPIVVEPESSTMKEPEEPPPIDMREELKLIIERVTTDPDCPVELTQEINEIMEEIKHNKVMARFVTILLRKAVDKILDPQKYFHFLELIHIVEEIAQSSGISRITQQKILEEYVELIKDLEPEKYPDCERIIKSSVRNKKYFNLVRVLSNCQMDFHLYLIQREFERFSGVEDWRGIVRLVEKMNQAGFSSKVLEYIWGNPKFVFIIEANVNNVFVLDAILTFQCKHGIPHFIPKHIADKLLLLLTQRGGGNFKWNKTWSDLSTAAHTFQTLFIRNTIPSEFPFILLRNILENPSLKQNFEKTGALIYWNQQDLHFNEPWDLTTLKCAIDVILKTTQNSSANAQVIEKNKRGRIGPMRPQEEQIGRLTLADYLKVIHLKGESRSNVDKSILRATAILKRYGSPLLAFNQNQIEGENLENLPVILTRVDLMTSLVGKTEPIVMKELIRLWTKYPIAIPLLVQNVGTDPTAYTCILPSIQRSLFGGLVPYHFILFIRIGEPKNVPGKSTLLNNLCMKNEHCFSSRLDDQGTKPSYLNGLLEFISCSAQNLNSQLNFYHQQMSGPRTFIGNLHGDALELPTPEILKLVSKISTAFVCIWMPQSWKSLQESKQKLEAELGSLTNVFDLCIDPLPEVVHKIDPDLCLLSGDVGEGNTKKMNWILIQAIKLPPMTLDIQELMQKRDFDRIYFTPPTRPSEIEGILGVIKKTNETRLLLSLQMNEFNTKQQIQNLFATNPDYVYLIGEFSKILLLPDNIRELALGSLSEELAQRSFSATKDQRNLLEKLHHENRHIKRTRNQILNRTLSIQHLIGEIGRIHNICPDKLYHFAQIPGGFPGIVADMMLKSYSIQIPSSSSTFGSESWFLDTLKAIKDKWSDLNIFVVSIFGQVKTGKTKILQSMFGSCFGSGDREEIVFETQGLEMRLIFLDNHLRESLSIDAILVLDSEVIVDSDPIDPTQKSLASLIFSISHFTLVTATKNNINMIGPIIELALVSNIRLRATHAQPHYPDILLTYVSGNDKLAELSNLELTELTAQHVNKAKRIANEYLLEAGVAVDFDKKMWKINLAIELGGIVHRISLPEHPTAEYHQEIVTLFRKTLSRVFGGKTTVPLFFETLQSNWREINKFGFPNNSSGADEIYDSLKLSVRLDGLKDLIDVSFTHHCVDNEYYIYTEMGKISRHESDDSELSGDTVKRNVTIEIQGRVADIYQNCNFEGKGMCVHCAEALREEEEILAEFSANTNMITNTIAEYLQMSRDTINRLTQQMMTSFEVKQLKGELSLNMKKLMRQKTGTKSSLPIWLTIKQDISTKLTVIPSKRRLNAEVKQVYSNVELAENLNEEFIQFEPAYDFSYLIGSSFDDNYLDWMESSWLLNELLKIPTKILLIKNARIFENGMIRELKSKVNKVLEELEDKNGKKLIPGFVLKVHGFVVSRLDEAIDATEKSWNKDYHPLTILNQNPKSYIKELQRMIAV